jgi:hypothetical protein
MSTFTVDTSQLPGLSEIVASLPLSLSVAGDGAPQIVALVGDPAWAARAASALAEGAMAVVIAAPNAAGADGLPPDAQARVVLAWDFAANPGVLAAGTEAAPLHGAAILAQGMLSVVRGTHVRSGALDLLVAADRVFGDFSALRLVHEDADGLYLTGHLVGGAPLVLSVAVTDAVASGLHLRLLTGDGGLDALVPSPACAAPAEVRVADAQGERLLPTVWVSSHRASWQRAAAVAAGDATSGDVDELLRVAAVAPELGRG